MYCHKCGKEIRNDAKFCNFCGAAVPVREVPKDFVETKPNNLSDPPETAGKRETAEERPYAKSAEEKKTGFSRTAKLVIGAAVLCAAVAVIIAVVISSGKPKKEETAAANPTGNVSQETNGSEESQDTSGQGRTLLPHETADPDMPSGETAQDQSTSEEESNELQTEITKLVRASFFDYTLDEYTMPDQPSVPEYSVGKGLSNVTNLNDFYLSDEVKTMIEKNGFAVQETGGREFFSIYERNRYELTPNFITVDSMMHTYHLYFAYLLKNTERNYLSAAMAEISARMLEASLEQEYELAGTEWEEAAARNVRFFAVGTELFGMGTSLGGEDEKIVRDEVSKIMEASGIQRSGVFDAEEDYSQYKPRGYYEGDEALEAYFRAMMWYGRMNFRQNAEELDRSALLITLAMDDSVFPVWEKVYAVTSFFAGTSDDNGYYEYRPVIDAVYGADATTKDLIGNEKAWQQYHALTEKMEAPRINSIPSREDDATGQTVDNKGFRFMGQRFTLDAAIFQNLMYASVEKAADNSARMLPDALDVPAVLGSDEAYSILLEKGNGKYPNYEEKVQELRSQVSQAPEELWSASLSARWLYTLLPLTQEKGKGWPSFMQSPEWSRKDLTTFLGSYAELKHDTILYAKQAMAEMGGDAIEEKDDRGYVEPEATVYARLSILTEATINGLAGYGILDSEDEENLRRLQYLSDVFTEISEKELKNKSLTAEEYDIIRTYGGQIEHLWKEAYRDEGEEVTAFEFPAAIITDVATDGSGSVLEIGTGGVNTIYAAVLIDGEVRIATGSVYSFYQFEQPIGDRLNDNEWRYMMGIFRSADTLPAEERPEPEYWTNGYLVKNAY